MKASVTTLAAIGTFGRPGKPNSRSPLINRIGCGTVHRTFFRAARFFFSARCEPAPAPVVARAARLWPQTQAGRTATAGGPTDEGEAGGTSARRSLEDRAFPGTAWERGMRLCQQEEDDRSPQRPHLHGPHHVPRRQ